MEELVKYMRAVVLLQLNTAVQRPAPAGGPLDVKPEVLLGRAGFGHREIAELLGKTPAAVAKTISRAKIAPTAERDSSEEALNE